MYTYVFITQKRIDKIHANIYWKLNVHTPFGTYVVNSTKFVINMRLLVANTYATILYGIKLTFSNIFLTRLWEM